MLGKTENIERLISLNDQYINKLRELLSNYKSRKNRKMNLLFQLAMFTTIVSLLITSYFAYSVDSTNVFIFRTYILIQTVLIVSCVGFAFRFAYNYAESTASVFQERNDIRIIAKHLYQISKRTSQLKEHTLKGDDYAIYRLEIDLKLIEAEDLFAKVLKINGIDRSIFKSIKASDEAAKEKVIRESLPIVPST